MANKGSILFLIKDVKGLAGIRKDLVEAGFNVQVTDQPKLLLQPSLKNSFQYFIVSLDVVDDAYAGMLPQLEAFLGAVSTIYSEFPQSSASRLLKLQHPSKIFGELNAKIVEQNYYQGRMRAQKLARTNQNYSAPIRWDGLNIYNPRAADQIFGGPMQEMTGEVWKTLNYLTVIPILQQGEGGYMMVGLNRPGQESYTKKVLGNWLLSMTNSPIVPAGASMEFLTSEISNGGIFLNPFFTVKGNKDLVCGLGIASQSESPPEALRSNDGYLAYTTSAIRAGMTVDFDIYMHLKQNEKFIRVVKAGTLLQAEQHRILLNNVSEFHVKEADKKQFQTFYTKLNLQQVLTGGKKAA
jgi:hypothetical protein